MGTELATTACTAPSGYNDGARRDPGISFSQRAASLLPAPRPSGWSLTLGTRLGRPDGHGPITHAVCKEGIT
jgi:hypothetical protein